MTLPYDNPEAQIIYRNILVFDADNNVIKAGRDQNFDGNIDAGKENNFTYQDGDLISIQSWNGADRTFSYSNIIDNMNTVDENTFGKKVGRVINAEMYAWDWQTISVSRGIYCKALCWTMYMKCTVAAFIKQKPDQKIMWKAARTMILLSSSFLSDVA